MKFRPLILMLGLGVAAGAGANDFPTQARVEYVLGCMDRHGGQSYDTLFPCVCSIDRIAGQMKYEEYAYIETMTVMMRTPGERGGAFRDKPGARKRVRSLKQIQEDAEKSCFVSSGASSATKDR